MLQLNGILLKKIYTRVLEHLFYRTVENKYHKT